MEKTIMNKVVRMRMSGKSINFNLITGSDVSFNESISAYSDVRQSPEMSGMMLKTMLRRADVKSADDNSQRAWWNIDLNDRIDMCANGNDHNVGSTTDIA